MQSFLSHFIPNQTNNHSGWILVLVSNTLAQCYVLDSYYDYYNFSIVYNLFFLVGDFLLLVIVIYCINSVLLKHLTSGQKPIKYATIAILCVMGALTASLIGLSSFNLWLDTPAGSDYFDEYSNKEWDLTMSERKLSVAWHVLYMLSVLAGAGLSAFTLMKMRSRNIHTGVSGSTFLSSRNTKQIQDIMLWTFITSFCLLLYSIFTLILPASLLESYKSYSRPSITLETRIALFYLSSFFQVFTYIAIICLGRLNAWDTAEAEVRNSNIYNNGGYATQQVQYAPMPQPHQQQQYSYQGQPGQQYYYPQPVQNTTVMPNKGPT